MGGLVGLAAVAAVAAAVLLWPDGDRGSRDAAERSEAAADPVAVQADFAPPDRQAVRDAYAEVARVYRAGGVSGLAEAGRRCFSSLAEQPSYRGLDYCAALDAFGAAFAQRVAGSPPPADSWFGQTEARFIQAATQVMGPERDAAARLVDIRRMAIEVARESAAAYAAAADVPAEVPGDPATEPAAAAPVPAAPVGPPARATSPATRPAGLPPSVELETVPPAPRASPASRPAAAPARPPVRRAEAPAPVRPDEAERRAYAAARAGPTAAEVAAARPRTGRGPSFNCRAARTSAERLICRDPELSLLDRQLNAAYEDAIAAGTPRRVLRLEQDRWLAVREAAAPDPDAVADAYRRRIRELEQGG